MKNSPRPQIIIAYLLAALVLGRAVPAQDSLPDYDYGIIAWTQALERAAAQDYPGPEPEWAPCDFEEGELTFVDRRVDPPRLRCGFLEVPENHARPTGSTVRLAFAIVAAEAPGDGVPLLYLIGGPGRAALNPYVLAFEAPALADRRDVIVLDQRGTGRSKPHLCPEWDRAEIEQMAADLPRTVEYRERRHAQRACLATLAAAGIDPASYDIAASVADIEALRRTLGYARWDLYGESYGAVLAQHVIREHPESVRSAILGKPLPTDWSTHIREVPNVAATLSRIFADCAADPACAAEYPDPEGDLLRAHAALEADPWTVSVYTGVVASGKFTINAVDYMALIGQLLYAETDFRHLPAVLRGFAERDARLAAATIERVYGGAGRGSDPEDGGGAVAIYTTIWCRDAAWAGALPGWEHAAEPYPAALRDLNFIYREDCEEWLVGPGPPESRRLVTADLPVLILSGAYDPVVPASVGMEQLAGFRNGRQIVLPHSSHDIPSSFEIAACVHRIMRDFLADPDGPLDTACVTELPPIRYPAEPPAWGGNAAASNPESRKSEPRSDSPCHRAPSLKG